MFVSPMLLQQDQVPPDDNNNRIVELKLDGFRMILSRFNNKTRLYTRHKTEITNRFPEITEINVPNGTVLDGELVAYDHEGKPDFEMLQSRFQSKRLIRQTSIQFMAFDILYYQGDKVTYKPLLLRKQLLPLVIPSDQSIIAPLSYIEGNATSYFNLIKTMDLEGIVHKNPNSLYKVGTRSKEWKKVINYKYTDALISGYRKKDFGLLLTDDDDKPLGIMEHMSHQARKEFYSSYEYVSEDKNFVYVKPTLKCKLKYRNLTKNNKLRIPVFMEWQLS